MAVEVHNNLFVGNLQDCNNLSDYSKVHVCKDPCHKRGVGYSGNLPSTHPNYLIKETENNLYLNLVDMNRILPQYTDEPFRTALRFIDKHLTEDRKVLVHCNLGQSRSCAIALVYLAIKGVITNSTYQEALQEFKVLYPNVAIGIGFNGYLQQNWNNIMRFL